LHTHGIRFLRRGLAILIAAVLAWVAYDYIRIWRSRIGSIKQAARILGSDLIRSADSIEYSEHENGKLRFKIHARKLLETRQGKNLLEGIEAFDFNPDGSPKNYIRSMRAEYDQEGGRAYFSGNVRIQMGKDVELRCESLFYDMKNNVGTTDDAMQLMSPQAKGSAQGIRFDNAARVLQLKRDVHLEVTRLIPGPDDRASEEKSRVNSSSMFYSENDRMVRFMGGARLETPDALLSGSDIEARLSPDQRRIVSLMCRVGAEYRSRKPGDAQDLRGDRIDFDLRPDGKAVERIRVTGNAAFSSESKDGSVGLQGGQIHLELDPADSSLRRILSKAGVRFTSRRAQGETTISGEDFAAEFSPGSSSVRRLQVLGNGVLTMGSGKQGETDELAAREIRVEFVEGSGQSRPRRLQAEGSVRWTSAARKEAPGRKAEAGRILTAARLDMVYSESGESLDKGYASGGVRVSILPVPGVQGSPIRRLEAEIVRFGFYPAGSRLRDLEGEGGVRVIYQSARAKEAQGTPAEEVQTTSEKMKASFRESDGQADKVSQWGGFTYRDGSRTATSGRADYDAGTEVLVLRDSPKVADPDSTTTGELLVYNLDGKEIEVRGDVRSVSRSKQEGGSALPGSTGSSAPTIVTAKVMRYWTEQSKARYEGAVQMLSEQGQLQARTLEILSSGRELTADGQVKHLIIRRPDPSTAGPPAKSGGSKAKDGTADKAPILIRSNQLRYDKSENMIHYSGEVILDSGDIQMWSDTLDAMLDAEGKQIEWARAIGHLRIQQQGRLVKGNQADYLFAPGKFVVLGDPAEIKDPVRGKSAARRLTFYTSDDRIILENS
jgi:LPS export ABC transporter protein LptC